MRRERDAVLWLAWRLVVGRGWRRFTLIALFAVPVLLSTAAMQTIGVLNLSGAQKARAQLGQASFSMTPTTAGKEQPPPAPALPGAPPSDAVVPIRSALSFPMVIAGRTEQIAYRESDWSSPLVSGMTRALSGRLPNAPDEVALSRSLAQERHLALGDTVRYAWAPEGAGPARIVGTVEDPTGYRARFAVGGPGLFSRWDDRTHTGLIGLSTGWLVRADAATEARITAAATQQRWQVTTRRAVSSATSLLEAQPGLLAVPGLALVLFSAAAAFSIRMRRLGRQLAMLSAVGFSGERLVRLARFGGTAAVAIGTGTGVVGGIVLGQALRPLLRSVVERDLGEFSVPYAALAVLAVGAAVSGVAGIWLPTRLARTASVRERLTRAPRVAGRSRRHTVLAVCGASGILLLLFSAARGAGVAGPVGAVLVVLAALIALPDLLHVLGRLCAGLPLAARFALRDLSRERRRPVAAVASSALAVVLAVSTASFVASQTEQDRRTHVGSRHLNQVELPLRNTEPSQAVPATVRDVLGPDTPVEEVRTATPAGVRPTAAGNRLSVPSARLVIGSTPSGSVLVVDTPEQFRDLTGRAPSSRERQALDGAKALLLDRGVPAGSPVALMVPPGPGNAASTPVALDAVLADPVDRATLSQTKALLSSAAARAAGLVPFTVSYRATLPGNPPADLEERLGRAVEPLGIPTSDIHVERGYEPPVPVRWSVTLTIGAAIALLSAMTAVAGAAQEIRPRMLLLRVIGFRGAVQRRILATQAAVIVTLAMVIGVLGGWLVAGSQLWPHDIPLAMPWSTIALTATGVAAASSALAAALRPRTDSRLRER
ncbi:FtsX-like permease family protein [Kitasatospora purpeofusca]|uniref:FtsX-like permease family protein n=1 Tax=Kitasatospora purpeofusca TaxID=67352 RepID=UPI0035D9A5EE